MEGISLSSLIEQVEQVIQYGIDMVCPDREYQEELDKTCSLLADVIAQMHHGIGESDQGGFEYSGAQGLSASDDDSLSALRDRLHPAAHAMMLQSKGLPLSGLFGKDDPGSSSKEVRSWKSYLKEQLQAEVPSDDEVFASEAFWPEAKSNSVAGDTTFSSSTDSTAAVPMPCSAPNGVRDHRAWQPTSKNVGSQTSPASEADLQYSTALTELFHELEQLVNCNQDNISFLTLTLHAMGRLVDSKEARQRLRHFFDALRHHQMSNMEHRPSLPGQERMSPGSVRCTPPSTVGCTAKHLSPSLFQTPQLDPRQFREQLDACATDASDGAASSSTCTPYSKNLVTPSPNVYFMQNLHLQSPNNPCQPHGMAVARRLAEATPQGLQAQARKNSPSVSHTVTKGVSNDVSRGTSTSTGMDSEDSEELEAGINHIECAYPPFDSTDDLVFDEADTYASEFKLQVACLQQIEQNTMPSTGCAPSLLSEDGDIPDSRKWGSMPPNADHQQVAGQLEAISQEFRQMQEFQIRLKQNGVDMDNIVAGGAFLNDDTGAHSLDSDD